jgi:hypothetical protein
MRTKSFKLGDKVAVLPDAAASALNLIEIAAIAFVGGRYIQLLDGRMYDTLDWRSLGTRKQTVIAPVTCEHWHVWRKRRAATRNVVASA